MPSCWQHQCNAGSPSSSSSFLNLSFNPWISLSTPPIVRGVSNPGVTRSAADMIKFWWRSWRTRFIDTHCVRTVGLKPKVLLYSGASVVLWACHSESQRNTINKSQCSDCRSCHMRQTFGMVCRERFILCWPVAMYKLCLEHSFDSIRVCSQLLGSVSSATICNCSWSSCSP